MLIHEALKQAGTVVCEPVERFQLEIPVSALPAATMTIARLAGLITGTSPSAGALAPTGTIPTRSVQALLAPLPRNGRRCPTILACVPAAAAWPLDADKADS